MKNINKKFLITPIALGALSLTTIAASCERVAQNSFDQKDDKKIVIAVGFKPNTHQSKALATIVSKYNEKLKQEKSPYTVEVAQVNGGYSGVARTLNEKLEAKDTSTFWNMAFNFPSIAASLAKKNMQLNLNEGENKVDVSQINKKFLEVNNHIEGLPQGLWTIPLARSSSVLAVDGQVFKYIFDNSTKNTEATDSSTSASPVQLAKVKAGDEAYFEKMLINQNSTTEQEYIATLWGKYHSVPASEGGLGGYEFSANMFDSFESIVDFSKRVAKSFPEGLNNSKVKAVLAVDGMEVLTLFAGLSLAKGDYSKFFLQPKTIATSKTNNGSLDYQTLLYDANSQQQKDLKTIYNVFKDGLPQKVLFSGSNTDRSSDYFKFHKLLFTATTTSGYPYLFFKDSVTLKDVVVNNKVNLTINNTSNLLLSSTTDKDALAQIQGDEGNSFVYPSTYTGDKTKIKGNLQSSSAELDKILKEALASSDSNQEKLVLLTNDLKNANLSSFANHKLKFNNKEMEFKVILQKDFVINTLQKDKLVGKDDMIAQPIPKKLQKDATNEVVNLQGLSIVGIHANKAENEETKKFINWLINAQVSFKARPTDSTEVTKTPIAFFAEASFYIPPISSYLNDRSNTTQISPFNTLAFDVMAKMAKGENIAAYEDIPDQKMNAFRDALGATWTKINNEAIKEKQVKSWDDFLKTLITTLGPQFSKKQ